MSDKTNYIMDDMRDQCTINDLIYTDHYRCTQEVYASYSENIHSELSTEPMEVINVKDYSDNFPPF